MHIDGQLRHQPALADTGLTGHQYDQRVPSAGQLPLLVECLPFVVAADERGGVGEQLQHRGKRRPRRVDIDHRRRSRRRHLAADQLMAITGPGLAQQRRHVRLDSPFRDVQASGDLGVREVLADQREHLRLTPRRHAVGSGRSNGRRPPPRDRLEIGGHQRQRRLRFVEAAQLDRAQVDQLAASWQCRTYDRRRCRADNDLTAPSDAAQPRHTIDRRTQVVAVAFNGFARVHANPRANCHTRRPQLDPHRPLQAVRGAQRVAGPAERRERRVTLTLGLDQGAALSRDHPSHDLVMASKRSRHRLRHTLPQLRRTHHIGEHERHHPRRHRSHDPKYAARR